LFSTLIPDGGQSLATHINHFTAKETEHSIPVSIKEEAGWTPELVWMLWTEKSIVFARNQTAIPWLSSLQPSYYTTLVCLVEVLLRISARMSAILSLLCSHEHTAGNTAQHAISLTSVFT